MRPTDQYIPVESNAPLRGLATTPASTRLDPGFSPNLLNCVVRDGVVRRRAGYQQLGQQLVGRVLALVQFAPIGEDQLLVALTSHRQYYYDEGTSQFVDITPGQTSYTVTANPSSTSFRIAGLHASDFPAGRLFSVVGGANQGVYTVDSASEGGGNTTISVEETMPAVATVAGAIVIADDLDTDDLGYISYASLTDVNGHRLLITNGADMPRTWTGVTTDLFEDWSPNFTDFVTCRVVAVFAEHLFLGGVTTSAPDLTTIAWSDAGDFDEFDVGQAGVQVLYQLKSPIKSMQVLGDRIAIYSDDAIMTGSYLGGTAVFGFEVVIPEGTRLASPRSICSINIGHVYLSEENFYLFDGTRGLRVLGDAIYSDYKLRKDQANLHLVCCLNDYAKRTLYYAVPNIEGGSVVYTAEVDVFDLSNISWAKEQYAHSPTAFGFYVNHTEALTWEDASWEPANMPWEDEAGSWVEESEQLEFPIRCFGDTNGNVFLVTEAALADNGTEVEQQYDTMDFTVPQNFHSTFARWGEIEFEALGGEVTVSYSGDLGRNWTETFDSVQDLTASYEPYRHPIDTTSRTLRVRFDSTSAFQLRWVRLWARPGGPR